MNALYKFFKSMKLAVGLFIYLAAVSIISTLIPQGKELAYYYHNFAPFWAKIIIALQFHQFFRSFLFIFPIGIFFLNLSVCTVDRLVRRLRKRVKLRFGPDLIHVGLLLLIVGGIVTAVGRQEGFVYLGEGDQIALPGDAVLQLESFEYLQYEDGRPKDWISILSVEKNGKKVVESFPVEVNKPLRLGRIKVFQTSYAQEHIAHLSDPQGQSLVLTAGQGFQAGDFFLRFAGAEGNAAIFEQWQGESMKGMVRVGVQESIGEHTLQVLASRDVTGLTAVSDPGYILVVVALILLTAGMALTIIQKIGDRKV